MAEADLDAVIRQISKTQNKSLMAAAKKRRDLYMARAAKAKDKETREQFKHLAKNIFTIAIIVKIDAAWLPDRARMQRQRPYGVSG